MIHIPWEFEQLHPAGVRQSPKKQHLHAERRARRHDYRVSACINGCARLHVKPVLEERWDTDSLGVWEGQTTHMDSYAAWLGKTPLSIRTLPLSHSQRPTPGKKTKKASFAQLCYGTLLLQTITAG